MEPNQKQEVDPRLIDKTKELIALKEEYSEKQRVAEVAKARAGEKELELLSLLESLGMRGKGDGFRLSGIGFVSIQESFHPNITDMEQAVKLFEEAGIYNEVLKLKPVNSRLSVFIKERLADKLPIPGLNFFIKPYVSIRKA